MEQFDSGEEQRNILKSLSNEPEMAVDDIYRALVQVDTSSFFRYSDKDTEQRRLLTGLLYFLRNRKNVVSNEREKWFLSSSRTEVESLSEGMPPFDTGKERENILSAIQTASQPKLGDIHSELVTMEHSAFNSLPTHGWNEERYILIALRDTLRENEGLITNRTGGNYQTWSLTQEGKQKVEQ